MVTVVGQGFERGSRPICKFGEQLVDGTFQSSTKVLCISPVHVAGNVSLGLSMNGEDYTRSVCSFHYVSRVTILSIHPSVGSVNGGDSITIVGTGFFPGLSCKFDDNYSPETRVQSSLEIVCISPFHDRNWVSQLSLWTMTHCHTSGQQFSFHFLSIPRLDSANITFVSTSSRMAVVTVAGEDLWEDVVCIFSHEPLSSISGVVSNGQLLCEVSILQVPSSETLYLEVARKQNDRLRSNRIPVVYRYSLNISMLTPQAFEIGGSIMLTMFGTGFSSNPPLCMQIANLQYAVEVVSSTVLVCEFQSEEVGVGSHAISLCPDSGYDLGSFNATIEIMNRVSLERIIPSAGPREGSNLVTIWGTSFRDAQYFCRVQGGLSEAKFINSTTIRCRVPEIADGDGLIFICVVTEKPSKDAKMSITSPNCLRYFLIPLHKVEGLVPSLIKDSKGKSTFIIGEGFMGTWPYRCLFGSDVSISAEYVTSSVLRCPIKDSLVGTYEVSISSGHWQEGLRGLRVEFGARDQVISVFPSQGYTSASNTVTVNGWGFSGFDTLFCRVSQYFTYHARLISDKEIICEVAAIGLHGIVGIDLVWRNLSLVSEPLTFEFLTSEITIFRVEPSRTWHGTGAILTVFGLEFHRFEHLYIRLSDTQYQAVFLSSSMVASKVKPASVGVHNVSVWHGQGDQAFEHSNYLPCQWVYPMKVHEVIPSTGPVRGGTLTTLIGENIAHSYLHSRSCSFGHTLIDCSYQTATSMTCITPASKSPGLVNVMI
eukprot:763810-Hanusia_phi.AAC.1